MNATLLMAIIYRLHTKKASVLFCTASKMDHAYMSVRVTAVVSAVSRNVEGHMARPNSNQTLNSSGQTSI